MHSTKSFLLLKNQFQVKDYAVFHPKWTNYFELRLFLISLRLEIRGNKPIMLVHVIVAYPYPTYHPNREQKCLF